MTNYLNLDQDLSVPSSNKILHAAQKVHNLHKFHFLTTKWLLGVVFLSNWYYIASAEIKYQLLCTTPVKQRRKCQNSQWEIDCTVCHRLLSKICQHVHQAKIKNQVQLGKADESEVAGRQVELAGIDAFFPKVHQPASKNSNTNTRHEWIIF